MVMAVPTLLAADPGSLNIYTGTTRALTSGMSSAVKSTTAMTSDGNGVYTGTVVLNSSPNGYYFVFGLNGLYGAKILFAPTNSDSPVNLASGASMTAELKQISDGTSGSCFQWTGSEEDEVLLSAKVDTQAMTVTLTNITPASTPSNYFNLNFTGAPNAYQYVTVFDAENSEELTPTSETLKIEFDSSAMLSIGLKQGLSEQGYSLSVTGPNGEMVTENFQIQGTSLGQYMMMVTSGASGITIDVNVKAPAAPTYSIDLKFEGDGFTLDNDLSSYITILDLANDGEELTLTNPSTYSYSKTPAGLNITSEEGYSFAIESSNPALEGSAYTIEGINTMDDLLDFGTASVLSLWAPADGLTFTITISKEASEPEVEKVYVAYATGQMTSAVLTANDEELAYNAEKGTYEGEVTLNKTGSTQRAVMFYAGTPGTSTRNYNAAAQSLNLSSVTSVTVKYGDGGNKMGWYITSGNWPSSVKEESVTLNVSLDPEAGTVTFSLPNVANPEAFYVLKRNSSYAYEPDVTLKETAANSGIYTGEVVAEAGYRFLLSYGTTTAGALGQKTGSTTVDVNLTSSGESVTIELQNGTQATDIKNAGTYNFSFDYNKMELTVTLTTEDLGEPDVTFNFTGTNNAFEYVTLMDMTVMEPISPLTSSTYEYRFPAGEETPYTLVFGLTDVAKEAGYTYDITCDQPQAMGKWMLGDAGGGQTMLMLWDAAKGLTFDVKVTNPKAAVITVNFTGVADGYKMVTVTDGETEENLNLTSSSFEYEIPQQGVMLMFSLTAAQVEAGYKMTITSPTGDLNPNNTYDLQPIDSDTGMQQYALIVWPGAAGYVFNVEVALEVSRPDLYIATGPNGNDIVPTQNDATLVYNAETGLYEGKITVTVNPSVYFTFYGNNGNLTDYYGARGQIGGYTQQYLTFRSNPVQSNKGVNKGTAPSNAGSWYAMNLYGDVNEATIGIAFDLEKMTVTFTQLEEETPGPGPGGDDSEEIRGAIISGNRIAYRNTITPSDKDAVFTYDETSKAYVGEVTIPASDVMSAKYNFLKLYKGTTDLTYYGPTNDYGSGMVADLVLLNIANGTSQTLSFGENTDANLIGGWYSNSEVTLNVSIDAETGKITFANGKGGDQPDQPKVGTLYLGQSSSLIQKPTITDQALEETETGVYEATLTLGANKPFNFIMKTTNGEVTYAPNGYSNIHWTGSVWPEANDTVFDSAASAKFVEGGTGSWIFGILPNNCQGRFEVVVDMNTMSIQLTPVIERASTPEKVYVYGNLKGYQIDARYENVATMLPSASNPNLFEVEIDAPYCGPFEADGEYSPLDGDPDYGYYFFLSTNGSSNSAGTQFQAPIENHLIEIPAAGNSYSVTALDNKTGCPFIVTTPGKIKLTFDYETLKFTATMITPGEVETDETGLYVAFLNTTYAAVTPSDKDLKFTYNEATQTYEAIFDYNIKQENKYMKFYQKTADGIITWGPLMVSQVVFDKNGSSKPSEFIPERNSPFYIAQFVYDLEVAPIKVTADLNFDPEVSEGGTIRFEQVIEAPSYPKEIYLWGSTEGGRNTHVCATMTPTADTPYIYEVTYDVPACVYDPADVMGGLASEYQAFVFFLGTSNESINKGTRFLGHYDAVDGGEGDVLIDLSNGKTHKCILQSDTRDGSSLLIVSPGEIKFTFNYETLEFTATMVQDMNYAVLTFAGNPDEGFEKYVQVTAGGNDYKVEVNPQTVWYNGDLNMTVAPVSGWVITVECLTENATVNIAEQDGKYTLTSAENGLTFLVTIEKDENDGIANIYDIDATGINVYNMQGVVILRNGNAEDLKLLEPGLYIVNGKKIVVRN